MQAFKQRMNFSRREQYAIIFLMMIMFILLVINIFPGIIISDKNFPFHNLDSISANRSSIIKEKFNTYEEKFDISNPEKAALAAKLTPFPFNPNKLPADDWRRIGLNDKQIQNILNFEKKGGKFSRKSDLQKIYSISLAEYKILEPFIEIPEKTQYAEKRNYANRDTSNADKEKRYTQLVFELNSIDSLQLIEMQHVGPWFAHRILQYRRSLGGFLHKEQLREVYGMDSIRYNQIVNQFTIDSSKIQLLAINRRTFKELIRHPYMNYNLVKSLVNKRERQGFVGSWNEVVSLNGKDSTSIMHLKPYLGYN